MKHFFISVRTVLQVQDFVKLAMLQPFDVLVTDNRKQVSGKNFMGMFTLDLRQPLDVQVTCDEASFQQFRQKAEGLLAS